MEKAGQADTNIGKRKAENKKRDAESIHSNLDSLGEDGEAQTIPLRRVAREPIHATDHEERPGHAQRKITVADVETESYELMGSARTRDQQWGAIGT